MSLLIDNRQTIVTDDFQTFFENAVQNTLEYLVLDIPVEISLLLVDNEEIRQLNREYRDKDQATDVLSFPLLELDPFDSESYKEQLLENRDPDTNEVLLGDIVISVEKAMEQAAEYGHGIRRELGFLMVHGMLHLLGYDHEAGEAEETEMFRIQEAVLNKMNLQRE